MPCQVINIFSLAHGTDFKSNLKHNWANLIYQLKTVLRKVTICYTNSWNWIVIAIAVAVTIDLVQIIRHSHSFAKKNLIFFNIQALITFTIKCFLFFLLCLYYYAIKLKIESFIYFLLSTTCTLIYARNRYIQ